MQISLYNTLLTRAECSVLRGIAILGIMLHNFCHWLNPIVKENEYQYFQRNVDWFWQVSAQPDILYPAHFLSFFGHYGVPIFLFLSAFGLEMKYGRPSPGSSDDHRVGIMPFVRYHYLKLFKMMIVGLIIFTIVDNITSGRWHYTLTQVVAQLGMFNNLLAHPDRNIWPGPYWYFGLMFQLYIVYRLLLYRRHWGWTAGLMAACLIIQLCLDPESETINRYRYNFMGGMLPFGLGLLFARYGERIILLRINLMGLIISMVATALFVVHTSSNVWFWHLTPLVVCYWSIYLVRLLTHLSRYGWAALIMHTLEWVGTISAALFVIHPVLRKIFIPISRSGDTYTGLLLYTIASLGVAWFIAQLMKKIPNPKINS